MRPKPTWHPYINRSDPLAQGLVGAWFALEGAGTLAHDLSRNGNHGSLQGGVSWVAGRDGPALAFDGGGDRVDAGSNSTIDNIFSGGGTLVARFNANSMGESDQGRVAQKGDSNSGWGLQFRPNNRVRFFQFFDSSAGIWDTPTGSIVPGQRYDVATVYDSGSAANDPDIYINSAVASLDQVSTGSGNALNDAGDSLILGNRIPSDRGMDGQISYLLLFSRALPAGQIRRLHHDPTRLLRPVRRWWPVVEVTAGITHPVIGSGIVNSQAIIGGTP